MPASACASSVYQCWVDLLERTSRTAILKSPFATGAQKLTVKDNGVPAHLGCSITARSKVAAVAPPNGPVKFQ